MKTIPIVSVIFCSILSSPSFATQIIDFKMCTHIDVPTNTIALLGRAEPNESCSFKYRKKIAMLEHHTTGLVTTALGARLELNYRYHINPETQEHDPEICIVAEEVIRELGL